MNEETFKGIYAQFFPQGGKYCKAENFRDMKISRIRMDTVFRKQEFSPIYCIFAKIANVPKVEFYGFLEYHL